MAVAKKKKSKPLAKKKRHDQIAEVFSAKAAAKREREIKRAIADFDDKIDHRYEHAKKIYDAQDGETQQAIDKMVVTMAKMAGRPNFTYQGYSMNADEGWMQRAQEKNFIWIAIRLLTRCAQWDIRIAKFKAPKTRCSICGRKVKP